MLLSRSQTYSRFGISTSRPLALAAHRKCAIPRPVIVAVGAQQRQSMGFWPRFARRRESGKLQQLLDVATAFAQQPSPQALQTLQTALGSVPLEELGVGQERSRHPISYQHIYEDRNVSMGIFALRAGAALPLHDHPGMHVLSRVLYGRLHVRSFDWADQQQRVAKLAAEQELPDGSVSVLGPGQGGNNLHTFRALTDTAVLDVLLPPYDARGGRDCTYYSAADLRSVRPGETMQLRKCKPPDDFEVVNVTYRGKRVQA